MRFLRVLAICLAALAAFPAAAEPVSRRVLVLWDSSVTTRWRDTFAGGMELFPVYSPSSDEVFGVYLQLNTLRLFYNMELLREVTGSDHLPRTLDELMALDRAVAAHRTAGEPSV